MKRYFDLLFYLIFKFYSKKEKGAKSSSAGIIGGLQASNVLTVIMAISFFIDEKMNQNKIVFLLVFIIFQISTYIRYIYKERVSIERLDMQWQEMEESRRGRIRFILSAYVILSVLSLFGIAYLLSTKL